MNRTKVEAMRIRRVDIDEDGTVKANYDFGLLAPLGEEQARQYLDGTGENKDPSTMCHG